ncbi:unnamed protein product, partial [Adineta ricciae]
YCCQYDCFDGNRAKYTNMIRKALGSQGYCWCYNLIRCTDMKLILMQPVLGNSEKRN